MIPELRHTALLEKTLDARKKIIVHEGGSGSSKTYSIAQAHLIWSFQEAGKVFTVARSTFPALKRSAIRDWERVLFETGLEKYFEVNKTDHIWKNRQTGTVVEFTAFDDEQKARGPRRDRLWCNEGNELRLPVYRQLARRTRGKITIDYNPSFQRHWIYDEILPRDDCEYFHSTYKDNDFLSDGEIREIEAMVPVYEEVGGTFVEDWLGTYKGAGLLVRGDPYEWAVYGLGQRGAPGEAIYPQVFDGAFPEGLDTSLGLDFGYNHAMVLSRIAREDRMGRRPALYVDELFHASYHLTDELIALLPSLGVTKREVIYCDHKPDEVRRLQEAGYQATEARKGPSSVYSGIQFVKQHDLYFTRRSDQGKSQHQDYRWRVLPDGTVSDVPVKLNDDSPDSVRMGAWSRWGRESAASGTVVSRRTKARLLRPTSSLISIKRRR